jgi:hypothetical protein
MAINIALNNTDMGDLFVSVLDLNIAGTPAVINNQRGSVTPGKRARRWHW